MKSLRTGQELKEVLKEMGESEGLGFDVSDVVGPIFRGEKRDEDESNDRKDSIDVDGENESDAEHTYPPLPGTAARQLYDELQANAVMDRTTMGDEQRIFDPTFDRRVDTPFTSRD